jgi:pimeloyl-ACP methyl ester carboxylesterase
MPYIQTADHTDLFVSEWGDPLGRPVVLVHAWGLSGHMWSQQIPDFVEAGLRCLTYDRRGHGRSDTPGTGYDLDTLADDLASVLAHFEVTDAMLVGHSMGAAEIVRYVSRHGRSRLSGLVLSAPTLPALWQSDDNPEGIPGDVIEAGWQLMQRDLAGWIAGFTNEEYFGATTPMAEAMWRWTSQQIFATPLPVALACQRTLARADLRRELADLLLPVLVIQGDADTSTPFELTGQRTAALLQHGTSVVVEGAGHGLYAGSADRYNRELLGFMARHAADFETVRR